MLRHEVQLGQCSQACKWEPIRCPVWGARVLSCVGVDGQLTCQCGQRQSGQRHTGRLSGSGCQAHVSRTQSPHSTLQRSEDRGTKSTDRKGSTAATILTRNEWEVHHSCQRIPAQEGCADCRQLARCSWPTLLKSGQKKQRQHVGHSRVGACQGGWLIFWTGSAASRSLESTASQRGQSSRTGPSLALQAERMGLRKLTPCCRCMGSDSTALPALT